MITADAIVKIAPAAKRYSAELVRQMSEAGIQANVRRASMFLGQIHVESGGFARVVESMGYSPKRLLQVFHGRNGDIKTLADAQALVSQGQEAVANFVYGGKFGLKNLGNTQPGDGWAFRGRGLKQLTGRDNYHRFSHFWLSSDELLERPDRVADPDGAVASAVWFWTNKKLNAVADGGSIEAVTRIVNGGVNGLEDREKATKDYMRAWSDAPDFSNVVGTVHSTEAIQ